ncbi:MAG: hypothetical protein CM15mV65_510 [Caudoviricetes sp.]|nr:MAG: hypothetical protein CM15mV65_510 [Caudoviricetes sp.]
MSLDQMGYGTIFRYTTRVDPDEPEPTIEFPLTDVVDFRPTCEMLLNATDSIDSVDTIIRTTHLISFMLDAS